MRRMIVVLVFAFALAACGGNSEGTGAGSRAEDSPSEPSPTPTATATEEYTPTYMPTDDDPEGAVVEIECWGNKQNTVGEPEDLALFWPHHFDDCSWGTAKGFPSAKEQRALETAYGKNAKVKSLSTLYGICAENNPRWMDYIKTAGSPSQLSELEGALILCPKHPQRQKVAGYVQIAQANNALKAQGRIFYDGTHRVGVKVPPGTYFSMPRGDGCYWERTDSAGNIIDNNFSNGLRVEMTVYASDYSITVNNCGEWRPVQ